MSSGLHNIIVVFLSSCRKYFLKYTEITSSMTWHWCRECFLFCALVFPDHILNFPFRATSCSHVLAFWPSKFKRASARFFFDKSFAGTGISTVLHLLRKRLQRFLRARAFVHDIKVFVVYVYCFSSILQSIDSCFIAAHSVEELRVMKIYVFEIMKYTLFIYTW